MATTITNGNIDTAAALIDAPYGPLTRVTDVATLPTPNSHIRLEFTDANGNTVFFTYEQLLDEPGTETRLQDRDGIGGKVEALKTQIAAIYALSNAMAQPHTRAEYETLIAELREIPELKGLY